MLRLDMGVISFTWNTSQEGVIWGGGEGAGQSGEILLHELQRGLWVAQGGLRAIPTSTHSWYTPRPTSQRPTTRECLLKQGNMPHPSEALHAVAPAISQS